MHVPSVNVVIIEDDIVLLQTYKMLIEPESGLYVSGIYTSFEQAEKNLTVQRPDVILLDIQLPGISGVDAIPLIKKYLPKVHVIMLTVFEFEQQIFKALQNGASGYITKDSSSTKIVEAIREVNEGGGPMSIRVARMVIKSFEKNAHSPLSKRETEILGLMTDGKKRNQIAEELFIERDTVKTHIKNIYAKLDVNSRSEAILTAKKSRLI
ncbi:MAG TPA: response regulator transcription factor [Mucilaginibacter sp.]|jgi:DNA-binding NarL/FixJ family response regulator|nr:response regulator transcription factor [Mucilaginibacter sp.]